MRECIQLSGNKDNPYEMDKEVTPERKSINMYFIDFKYYKWIYSVYK